MCGGKEESKRIKRGGSLQGLDRIGIVFFFFFQFAIDFYTVCMSCMYVHCMIVRIYICMYLVCMYNVLHCSIQNITYAYCINFVL